MCVVSMVTDHYRDRWPMRPGEPSYPYPLQPTHQVWPFIQPQQVPSQKEWDDYLELKRKAEEYDRLMMQPDCEKPGVAEWEARMTEIVKRVLDQQNGA